MTQIEAFMILGITQNASHEEIKQAYRSWVRRFHPDKFTIGSNDWEKAHTHLKNIYEAYDILKRASQQTTFGAIQEVQRRKEQKQRPQKKELMPVSAGTYFLLPLVFALFRFMYAKGILDTSFSYFRYVILPGAIILNPWLYKTSVKSILRNLGMVSAAALLFVFLYAAIAIVIISFVPALII